MKREVVFLTLLSMLWLNDVTAQTVLSTDGSSPANTGLNPEPPIYRIETHLLKQDGQATYEAAVKSLVKGLGSARIRLASWDFSVATDGGSTYFTIDPMPNWAMLDHFRDDGVVVEKAMPEIWAAFRSDVRSVREREDDFFIQTQPSSDDPGALGEDGRDFMHVEICYPKDSRSVFTSLNSLKKLYASLMPDIGTRIYVSVTGDDLPFFWFVRSAKDRERYLAAEARIPSATRINIEKLLEQAHQGSKHTQTIDLTIRQDLSYHVPQAAETTR